MKAIAVSTVLVTLCSATLASAQEFPEFPKPQQEHEWLQRFLGEWESEAEAPAAPGQPAMKCKGTIKSRMLGGFWMISESQVDMQGTQVNAVQTVGYDPEAKQYVGTWVDSMFNYLWKYTGSVDESGKKLTLEAEGPNFLTPGKTCKFRDAYEFTDADHIVVTSSMQGDDGKWVTFMTANVRRKK
jgi:hypothetical protein